MRYPVLDAKATGARIKELRKTHNLKVGDVAKYMGFESEQAIYKWQRGESLPTVDNLYALSVLFETSIDDILRGDKEVDASPLLPFYGINSYYVRLTKIKKLTFGLVHKRDKVNFNGSIPSVRYKNVLHIYRGHGILCIRSKKAVIPC